MSKKKVIIVESPAKSRTLTKYLGKDFTILASMGHVIDLPSKKLSVDVDAGFEPHYEIIPGKKKILINIRKAVNKDTELYLASDPDREGEAIAYHIAKALGFEEQAYRVLFNEITKKAILCGVENPGKININKVYAQQARRILDRLVGYKVSPMLWRIMNKTLSAGRVQSVALKILSKREQEILSFIQKEFWTIDLELNKESELFPAKVTHFKDKKLEIENGADAKKHCDAVKKSVPIVVDEIEKKQQKRYPSPPFVTSMLQLEASRKLGFSPKKTMRIAQQLYEGMELGDEELTGLITYMRTDSVRISVEARDAAKKFIQAQFGKNYVGKGFYKSKKSAQDAHEAIRPTVPSRTPQQTKDYLSREQQRLYELIWKRFIASQMSSAELEKIAIHFVAGDYTAKSSAITVIFEGFLKLWEVKLSDEEDENSIKLPELKKGEEVDIEKIDPVQHFTKPPARYTQGTLVKELESQGIGRPSTYAQIISTLLDREYARIDKKKLFVTELGTKVNELLQKMFPEIFEEKFTAQMEKQLDEVEQGDKSWQQLLKEFYEPFSVKLIEISKNSRELKQSLIEKTKEKCPKCGAELIIRWGRYGRFIACPNFPKCRYTKPLNDDGERKKSEIVELDEKCPECSSKLLLRRNRYGGRFIACSNYPKCKYARPYVTEFQCPKPGCNSKLIERSSKKGRLFYTCEDENCDFIAFDEPVEQKCQKCGAPVTFIRRNKTGEIRHCVICGMKEKKTPDGEIVEIKSSSPSSKSKPKATKNLSKTKRSTTKKTVRKSKSKKPIQKTPTK